MERSKKTQKPNNQEIMLRRSPGLDDMFQKLTDDNLILEIFSKLQDDTKSLIRCSFVSKKWSSLVSTVDTLSFRFFLPENDDDSPPCLQSHLHIPISAIPALMKVFSKLKSLEVKVCLSQPCQYNTHRLKGTLVVSSDQVRGYFTHGLVTLKSGLLATSNDAALYLEPDRRRHEVVTRCAPLTCFLNLYKLILRNCPETLTSVVITSAKIQGLGSEGMVFMTTEQQRKFRDVILNSRLNRRWLENQENVVYWLKKDSPNQFLIRDEVWIVHRHEFTLSGDDRPNLVERNAEEIDIKELLEGLDNDD